MGLGFSELLIILVAAIVFVGPDRLPKVAIEVAKFLRTCRTLMWDIRDHVTERDISNKPPDRPS